MPFQYILANLLAQNEKSVGVLFLDGAGETVDLACSEYSPNDMRIVGAYVGIYLRQIARFLDPEQFGHTEILHIENEGLHVFAKPLPEGYFLVLAQRPPSLTARSRRSLGDAVEQLSREIFAES